MSVLEQRIIESGEASVANASLVDMQQVSHFIFIVFSFSDCLTLCTSTPILGSFLLTYWQIAEQLCLFLASNRR